VRFFFLVDKTLNSELINEPYPEPSKRDLFVCKFQTLVYDILCQYLGKDMTWLQQHDFHDVLGQ